MVASGHGFGDFGGAITQRRHPWQISFVFRLNFLPFTRRETVRRPGKEFSYPSFSFAPMAHAVFHM